LVLNLDNGPENSSQRSQVMASNSKFEILSCYAADND